MAGRVRNMITAFPGVTEEDGGKERTREVGRGVGWDGVRVR